MASLRRLEKLNILLKDELAKIVSREIEFPEGMMTTITRVTVSPDARYATVFLSIFGMSEKAVLEILQKNVYHLQQLLNRKLRMRPVPKINFTLDEEEMKREGVETSLAKLKMQNEI